MKLKIIGLQKLISEYGQQYVEEHIQASVRRVESLDEDMQERIISDSGTWMPGSQGNSWPLFINDIADKNSMLEFMIIVYESREDIYNIEFVGRIKE
ncbi:hypothetical protein EVA_20138 [gut metagenome]|uniref:Uncharacterized protein n=1 Tax=gut metagenome TaxID=749906 RepID=J9FBE3_9ZZZZ